MTFLQFLRNSNSEAFRNLDLAQFIRQIAADCGRPKSISNFYAYYRGTAPLPMKHRLMLGIKYQIPRSIIINPDIS